MTDELERRLGAAAGPALDLDALRSRLARRAAREGLLDVAYGRHDSPLGRLTVMVTPRGLVRLSYPGEEVDSQLAELADRISPRIMEAPERTDEVRRPFPGADVIPGGRRSATMAVTIDAPPARVWPWLVQMGCDRAGWYAWDRLDNGGVPSAERIHPEWQDLSLGDRLLFYCVDLPANLARAAAWRTLEGRRPA